MGHREALLEVSAGQTGRKPRPTRLELSTDEYRVWSSASVAFREGRPVVLESSEGSAIQGESFGSSSQDEDWESLTFGSTSVYTKIAESGDSGEWLDDERLLAIRGPVREGPALPPALRNQTGLYPLTP